MQTVNAMDLVSPEELHQYGQEQMRVHGETPEALMVLLVKLTAFKAILEDALDLDAPLIATLEKGDDQ